jgi:hypothetical protein
MIIWDWKSSYNFFLFFTTVHLLYPWSLWQSLIPICFLCFPTFIRIPKWNQIWGCRCPHFCALQNKFLFLNWCLFWRRKVRCVKLIWKSVFQSFNDASKCTHISLLFINVEVNKNVCWKYSGHSLIQCITFIIWRSKLFILSLKLSKLRSLQMKIYNTFWPNLQDFYSKYCKG